MEGWVRRSQGWSVTPFSLGRSGLSLEFAQGRISEKFQFAIIVMPVRKQKLTLNKPGGVRCYFHWGDLGWALNLIEDQVNNKDNNPEINGWERTIKTIIILMPVRKQDACEPWRCASLKLAWQTFSAILIRKIRIEPWIHTRMNLCLNSVFTKISIWLGDKNETLFVRSRASRCEFHSFYHRLLDENNNQDKIRSYENLLEIICWLVCGLKNENLAN